MCGGVNWQSPTAEQGLIPTLPEPLDRAGRCSLPRNLFSKGDQPGAEQLLLLVPVAHHFACSAWQKAMCVCVGGGRNASGHPSESSALSDCPGHLYGCASPHAALFTAPHHF